MQEVDPKAAAKKAPAKGAPPPKAGSTLEAITDNRPRVIQYIMNVAED